MKGFWLGGPQCVTGVDAPRGLGAKEPPLEGEVARVVNELMQSSESARTVWLASRNEHRIVSWPFHRLLRLLRAPQGRFPSTTRKSPVSHYDKDESVTPSELISNLQGYVIHAIPSVGPLADGEMAISLSSRDPSRAPINRIWNGYSFGQGSYEFLYRDSFGRHADEGPQRSSCTKDQPQSRHHQTSTPRDAMLPLTERLPVSRS